ncbi:hypothetical protein RhiJN_16124 [Ceratobasidium sp. AG-Ba]|nr:hypothetical protein RhiJN_16124 [Ceratobasidium sp. AG-Ba]
MSTTPTTTPETIAYRQKLALHVLPHSPALARRYAARLRKLNPSLPALTPISCPHCGNIFAHGRGNIRMAGLWLRTAVCAGRSRTHARFQAGNQPHQELKIAQPTAPISSLAATSVSLAREKSVGERPAGKQPRSKSGLQSMLQRNREREMHESQKASTPTTSLASFLQGL